MELLSRRRMLRLSLWAGGLAAGGALAFGAGLSQAGAAYRRLVELPEAPTGTLGDEELAVLLATVRVLLPAGVEEARYADFFRFHAQEVPGKARLYERFRAVLDKAARKEGAADFAQAPAEVQLRLLGPAREVRRTINEGDRVSGLVFGLFSRDWLRFERYIVREVLTLFARTDAWLLAGYGPFPGVPRGLEAYRAAPGVAP